MQVGSIDFQFAADISVQIIVVIVLVSLMFYYSSIRKVLPDVTKNTKNALYLLGLAGISLVPIAITDLYAIEFFLISGGIFFTFINLALQNIFYTEEGEGKLARYATIILILLVIIDTIVRLYIFPELESLIFVGFGGALTLAIMCLVYSGILLRETPTVFTTSLFILIISFMLSRVITLLGIIAAYPQYFIIQAVPLIFACMIFSNVLRPWKNMVATFLMTLIVDTGLSLIYTGLEYNAFEIIYFVAVASLAGLSLMVPLNYFVQQYIDSRARTPLYMGIVLISLALMLVNHSIAWSIFVSQGQVWDEILSFIDLVFGLFAASAFIMAGASGAFSEWGYQRMRDFAIIMMTGTLLLGSPIVRGPDASGAIEYSINVLFPILGVVIAIGILFFARVTYRMHKRGATAAAMTFILFIMSSLTLAIVMMFTAQFLAANLFEFSLALLSIAAILALLSSPPVNRRIYELRKPAK